jgi:membrane-bound serine protease (ClpP class)
MKKSALFILLLILSVTGKANEIHVIEIQSVINPASAKYMMKSIEDAEEAGAECLIIELDTPGGLMTSMRDIIKSILNAYVPVVVYVSPAGAQAASAGVFITVSAHVAAMTPESNIGAAHPVSAGGGLFGGGDSDSAQVMMEKVTNDAVAYIQSIAEEKGRNAEWAKEAVEKSVSITAKEALELNVIDIIAPNLEALIDSLDGRQVKMHRGETLTLETKEKKIIHKKMGWNYKLLDIISNPNISYILLMLGFYGLFFELSNPGNVFPGVMGALFLILAFYSFQILPINFAGLALIVFGIILLILEIKIVSYGLLSIGGVAAMILGSIMLIDTPDPLFQISKSVILTTVAFSVVLFLVAVRLVIRAMQNKPTTGYEGMLGMRGYAETEITELGGTVMVNGEIWRAVSDQHIPKASNVIVTKIEYMQLTVEKA